MKYTNIRYKAVLTGPDARIEIECDTMIEAKEMAIDYGDLINKAIVYDKNGKVVMVYEKIKKRWKKIKPSYQ